MKSARYRLTLWGSILVVVAIVTWCITVYVEGKRHHEAATLLMENGFAVRFGDQDTQGNNYFDLPMQPLANYSLLIPQFEVAERKPAIPKEIRGVLGEYCFTQIVDVGYMADPHGRAGVEEALGCIARIPSIERVSLATAPISDDDLSNLKNAKRLRTLILAHTEIDGSGLKYISSESVLYVNLEHTKITPAALNELSQLKTIKALNLQLDMSEWFSSAELSRLVGLANLRELYFDGYISDEGCEAIAKFDRLEVLSLGGTTTGLTDAGLRQLFLRCKEMRRFDVFGGGDYDISGSFISAIEPDSFLTALSLRGFRLDDDDIAPLAQHRNLESINLEGSNITDRGLSVLSKTPSLKHLILNRTRISLDGLKALGEAKNLKSVEFGGPLIGKVSEEQRANIERELPGVTITIRR